MQAALLDNKSLTNEATIETWRLEARKEVVLSVSGMEIKVLEATGGRWVCSSTEV